MITDAHTLTHLQAYKYTHKTLQLTVDGRDKALVEAAVNDIAAAIKIHRQEFSWI
jgi:hypothetical protein